MLPRSIATAGGLVALDYGVLFRELLRGATVLVAQREFFRRGKLNCPGIGQTIGELQRAFEAFFVEPKRGVCDARLGLDPAHHIIGVRHAGHCFGIDERDNLNVVEAGLRQSIDQRDLARGGNWPFLDLEALARTFLGDANGAGQIAHDRSLMITDRS